MHRRTLAPVTGLLALILACAGLLAIVSLTLEPEPFRLDAGVARNSPAAVGPAFSTSPLQRVPLREDRHALPSQATPTGQSLPEGLQASLEASLDRDSYDITPQRDHPHEAVLYQAHNRAQGLHVGFSPDGIHVVPRGFEAELSMEMAGVGYGDLQPEPRQGP